MKARYIYLLFLVITSSLCAEPVIVPKSESPQEKYHITLSTDNDRGLGLDEAPIVSIIETETGTPVCTFDFPADVNSDARPLRKKVRAIWNQEETAVALEFSERFYTHLLVFQREQASNSRTFVRCSLPNNLEIIKAAIPGFKEFRSRWHTSAITWLSATRLLYRAGTGAITTPRKDGDVTFMATYRFTVKFIQPDYPIIENITYIDDE
jgi:hypothetical protein